MPKYLFQWTETHYNEAIIDAANVDNAEWLFESSEIDAINVDVQFGEGPVVTEVLDDDGRV